MTTSIDEIMSALAASPVLTGISTARHALIAAEGTVHDFPAGAWIVREGEEGHAFFILMAGDVEVVKSAGQPNEVALCKLSQGNFFGEMCILAPMPRAASIRTVGPVRAIEIKATTLHHLYQKMPEQYSIMLLNLARDLARRLCRLDNAFLARAA